jgi:hypothetical protein
MIQYKSALTPKVSNGQGAAKIHFINKYLASWPQIASKYISIVHSLVLSSVEDVIRTTFPEEEWRAFQETLMYAFPLRLAMALFIYSGVILAPSPMKNCVGVTNLSWRPLTWMRQSSVQDCQFLLIATNLRASNANAMHSTKHAITEL